MQPRHIAIAVASSLALMLAAQTADADQKVKTKSNIKNDRMANTCSKDCQDAGYAWARENGAASDADCDAPVEDFAQGCRDFVADQLDASGPMEATDAAAPLEVTDAADAPMTSEKAEVETPAATPAN